MLALPADRREFALLNDYQQRFPLCGEPFAAIGDALGWPGSSVLAAYRRWQAAGVISRIGPVFAPQRVGASTLAALAVPPARLAEVAAQVSARPEINHNYEREHAWNLWYVATAPDAAALQRTLAEIAAASACPQLVLPLVTPYHIDLGFDLAARPGAGTARPAARTNAAPPPDRRLLAALQDGLPLVDRPYRALAAQLDWPEETLRERLAAWLDGGLIKRFGVVVRHHELGWRANAMCVWAVPPAAIDRLGQALAGAPDVTLCYRRQPSPPDWPYNLYCMIHGRARPAVLATRAALAARLDLDRHPHAVLFSARRFKQCGARYARPETCDA